MAIVNRNKGTTSMDNQSQSTTDTKSGKVVDIFDKNLQTPRGDKKKLDSSQADEAWGFGAPPPKGYYDIKPMPSKDCFRYQEEYGYYSANLECRIVSEDKDFDNIPIFATVTTKLGRGKNISTMGALIVKLGFKLPEEIDDLGLCQLLATALKKEHVLKGNLLDWRGGYKKENGDWQNVFSTMTQFPQLADHNYNFEPMVTKAGGAKEPIRAQVQVVEFGDYNVEKARARMKDISSSQSQATSGKPNGGIQLSKSNASSQQGELVLESEDISATVVDLMEGITEDDLKLAEG